MPVQAPAQPATDKALTVLLWPPDARPRTLTRPPGLMARRPPGLELTLADGVKVPGWPVAMLAGPPAV